jgi:hypothetical protein
MCPSTYLLLPDVSIEMVLYLQNDDDNDVMIKIIIDILPKLEVFGSVLFEQTSIVTVHSFYTMFLKQILCFSQHTQSISQNHEDETEMCGYILTFLKEARDCV